MNDCHGDKTATPFVLSRYASDCALKSLSADRGCAFAPLHREALVCLLGAENLELSRAEVVTLRGHSSCKGRRRVQNDSIAPCCGLAVIIIKQKILVVSVEKLGVNDGVTGVSRLLWRQLGSLLTVLLARLGVADRQSFVRVERLQIYERPREVAEAVQGYQVGRTGTLARGKAGATSRQTGVPLSARLRLSHFQIKQSFASLNGQR